ncbi:MAG TPA: FRG domain-containing protein [Thermoanaerobaculia bacterium]|jgi:hypothetical protein|nr:FRG domain-containing protein [Thermoanaerobaculia bacterium]
MRSLVRHRITGERPWQKAYLRFRELERQLTDEDARGWAFLTLLRAAAQGSHVFKRKLREYQAVRLGPNPGLPEPPAGLIDELQTLARLRSSYDREETGFVFEDVYHLAFHNLMWWRGYGRPIPPAADCRRLYRGQRKDTWEVGAKIYRGLPEGPERQAALRVRAASACQIGHAIAERLGFSFEDAMAVAQHYSAAEILGVPTWLVDFSRDPWVGLFFASDGGETGDLGIVWDIMPTEYTRFSAGEGNPIGPLQIVVPQGVLRIDNQAGVFVIAGLPQIFDQYVAFGWDTRFRQHTGLRFEDPVLGISADTIYPPEDPLRATLAEVRAAAVDCGCGPGTMPCAVSPAVFTDPFDPKTYEGLLTCWLEEFLGERAGDSEPAGLRAALADLAGFHARLHAPDYAGRLPNIVSRSLNRLRDAFEALCFQASRGEPLSLRGAVEKTYVNQMFGSGDQVAVLLEALNETLGREARTP